MFTNLFDLVLAHVAENRGFTVTKDFQPFTGTGYVVGGVIPPVIIPLYCTDPAVLAVKLGQSFGEVDLSMLSETLHGWGGWPSGEEYYVDAVTFISDREEAIELGRARGELAIGEFKDGEYITDIEL